MGTRKIFAAIALALALQWNVQSAEPPVPERPAVTAIQQPAESDEETAVAVEAKRASNREHDPHDRSDSSASSPRFIGADGNPLLVEANGLGRERAGLFRRILLPSARAGILIAATAAGQHILKIAGSSVAEKILKAIFG